MIRSGLLWMIILIVPVFFARAQTGSINGKVTGSRGEAIESATVDIPELNKGTVTGADGWFNLKDLPAGAWQLRISFTGYETYQAAVPVKDEAVNHDVLLNVASAALDEMVVTGTMKAIRRSDSPVPVEIITPALFRKNPVPALFEAIGMVNGVQPQLNCNVCNTGDIHINGMEGPYTMILIDGMPIVSALSTVYGLSGIPNSMVERIEVVKGPASSLYGSEAMGGIINVITKQPDRAPLVSADIFGTGWGEVSADAAVRFTVKKATALLGINYFNFQQRWDKNNDHFTDLTLQHRISVFNKWRLARNDNRLASLAARYVYEDRWGGEMNWSKTWRGSDHIYGESVYTRRAEIIGLYQLPFREKIFTQFSYNWHNQNSWYGNTPYMATQQVGFIQTYWDKQWGEAHNFLLGASMRYTIYDDNTPATASADGNRNEPARTPLPGVFIQDEWTITSKHKLLAGYRYDYNNHHGSVHSPRVAYKFSPDKNNTLRASFGTGFRVVNLFTEDHAALTGAREVVIASALNPEKSYNANLNYVLKIPGDNFLGGFDITGFYSYFTNKIVGDFETDPAKIIYDNLQGHAISRGASLNADLSFAFPLKLLAGISYMDVFQVEANDAGKQQKSRQLHAPVWSGSWVASYTLPAKLTLDLTGNWYGPMRLPVHPRDFRPAFSPWFCIANMQLTKAFHNGIEIYGGVKNIFDFIPRDPIMRPFDPFDRTADDVTTNPNGYTFDPSYNYASLQGIRVFAGVRYNLFK